MKVCFVHIDRFSYFKYWGGMFHFGLASLSAVLKKGGHETSLIHVTGEMDKKTFIESIKKHNPDLVAFTSTTITFPWIAELALWLSEEKLGVPTICGGVHATLNPTDAINREGIDMICRGEGEYPLLELCDCMEANKDFTKIQNLWIKRGNKIIENPIRSLIENLDELPFPDRKVFDYENLYFEKNEGEGSLLVSRGCPYDCSYCCNHALRNIYKGKGKYVRFQSVDYVIKEIKELRQDYPFVKRLLFYDDILFQQKKWMKEFVPRYKSEVGLPFSCNIRPNLVDEEIVDLLKEAGCYCVRIGLESGNNYIRNTILNRNLTDDQMNNAFAIFRKANIDFWTFNIVGMPCEDSKMILDTIKINARAGTSFYSVGICYPFPGTKLYDFAKEKEMLGDKRPSDLYSGSALTLELVDEKQLLMFERHFVRFIKAYRGIYLLPSPVSGVFEKLLDGILSKRKTPYVLEKTLKPAYFVHKIVMNLFTRSKNYERL